MTVAGPSFQREPHRDRVERIRQRLGQRHGAEIFVLEIFRLPAPHRDRRVLAHRVGRKSVFERGEIDERLEGGAGLAFRRYGAVELALLVAPAADQGANGAVRRHGDEGAFADAEFFSALGEPVDESLLCVVLQRRID